MVDVLIHFAQGHVVRYPMPSYTRAITYARNNISFSTGAVRRVEIETEPVSVRAVWDEMWDEVSMHAGLWA